MNADTQNVDFPIGSIPDKIDMHFGFFESF